MPSQGSTLELMAPPRPREAIRADIERRWILLGNPARSGGYPALRATAGRSTERPARTGVYPGPLLKASFWV